MNIEEMKRWEGEEVRTGHNLPDTSFIKLEIWN